MTRFLNLYSAAVPALAITLGYAGAANAVFLTNGDFEDTTGWTGTGADNHPVGWGDTTSANPSAPQSGVNAIGGSGTSAFISSSAPGNLRQTFTETPADFQFDIDFASEDPGALRSFTGSLQQGVAAVITWRIFDSAGGPQGDFQFFSGGWQSVASLNDSVIFDSDVTAAPLTHNFAINGNFDDATPNYDVTITNSLGATFTATGLTLFHTVTPDTGDGIDGLQIHVGTNTQLTGGDYLLDNATLIPEPASAMLLASGVALMFTRRRR